MTWRFVSLALGLCCSAASASEYDQLQLSFYAGGGIGFQHSLVAGLDKSVNAKPMAYLIADVEYRGFFMESIDKRRGYGFGQGTIGYRFWQQGEASLSIIGSNVNGLIDEEVPTVLGTVKIPELTGITARYADFMVGLRWQQLVGNHYYSVDAGKDIDYHYGYQARAYYSYRQILRNWDLYYNVGLQYAPPKVLNYYYGVKAEEATPNRAVYQAGSGWQLQTGLAAVYPLTQQWLFETGLTLVFFSKAYTDSPLVQSNTEQSAFVGVRYVF